MKGLMTTSSWFLSFIFVVIQLFQLGSCASNDTKSASGSMQSLFNSAEGVQLSGGIVAMAAITLGMVTMVLGYRLFRVTLFGVGFAFGGSVVALILEHVFAAESWVTTASFVGFVVGGALCGFLVLCLLSFGVFAVGATAGVLLAMVLNDSICYMLYPSQPDLVLASLCVVFGLLSGVLALMLEKPVLIIATSLFGAGLLVWGVGYFAGDFPTFINLKEYAIQDDQGEWMYTIPGSWMAYFIGFTVLFVLGMLIQFRKSSRRGRYHKRHTRGRKTRNAPYVQA